MPQNLLEHVSASYWLPVILAVDGGFPVHAASHLLGRSLSLVFLAPTAWRTGSAIRGSVTTYRPLVGLGVKRREEFGRRISILQCQSSKKRQPFSLGSSALHVQDVRKTNRSVVSRSPTSVFLGSGGNF
ncbi:hypothetical protein TNCV_120121 [Trichonephila clavipes]|nr:hypothetical protein TNCV_120121 [Trichonephila clavipes]